jgi:hypothetical protein
LAPPYDRIRELRARLLDLNLQEIRAKLALTGWLSALWKTVNRLSESLEKKVHPAEQNCEGEPETREQWWQRRPQVDQDRLVFLDETWARAR